MDNEYPKDQESSATGRESPDDVMSRRRFTRAGVAGSIVLGSLASKPVLGSGMYHCTVSGQVSGNLSRPGLTSCAVGKSTQHWIDSDWPSGFKKGALPNQQCNFTADNGIRPRGTNFNRYTPGGGVPALIDAFYNSPTGSGLTAQCSIFLPGTTSTDPATMLQVLNTTNGGEEFQLGASS